MAEPPKISEEGGQDELCAAAADDSDALTIVPDAFDLPQVDLIDLETRPAAMYMQDPLVGDHNDLLSLSVNHGGENQHHHNDPGA